MKPFACIVIAVAFVTTSIALWPPSSGAFSSAALRMLWWPLSPYLLLALLIWAARTKAATTAVLVVGMVASVLGTALILDLLYIHTDALNGLLVMMVPVAQWGLLIVLGLTLLLSLNRVKSA